MDKRKEVLIGSLQDGRDEIRRAAADALEKLEVRERLDEFASRIAAGEMLEKIKTLYLVSELKGQRVVEILSSAARDPSEDVRAASVRALAANGDVSALPVLVELFKDSSPIVARAAIEAASAFRDRRTLAPLMQMLKHSDPGVVERAIEAVGRLGDKRCEDAFIYFAVKGNVRMRELALRSIGTMDR